MVLDNIMKRVITVALLGISFLLGVVSIILVKLDPQLNHIWLPFWLHIISFLLVCVSYVVYICNPKKLFSVLHEKEIIVLSVIILGAIFLSFFQLTLYPYSSLGDEVRDSGLYAQQIAHGQIRNIFGYGAYDGYGLIIPTIASLFYNVFGGSVLTYRFPAALVSVLDIVILYLLIRQIANKIVSALGASILAVLPMHLFFARTQLVVVFNGLWTTLMLFATYALFETNSLVTYVFLGSLLGFSSQFHATTRVIAILLFLLTVLLKALAVVRRKISFHQTFQGMVLLIAFAVVSFGPQMLFSNTENFFHTGRFLLQENLMNNQGPSITQMRTIGQNYVQSLGAWVVSPVGGTFFHDDQPLVPIFLLPLFFVGIGYAVAFVRKSFLYMLFGLLFLIPFFSSAITDAINADQRLNSALPVAAIFCSIGIYVVLRILKKQIVQWIFVSLVSIYIVFLGVFFFVSQRADIGRELHEYISMNVIYAIQNQISSSTSTKTYCLITSKNNWLNFNYMHYQEQHQYFLPGIMLDQEAGDSIPDSEAYLYKGACATSKKQPRIEEKIDCTGALNFMCARNWKGTLKLYSD